MPARDHLTWTEIKDFRPGLWTMEPLKAPASAATQMDNCYPGPNGGLYPFFRPSSNTTGVTLGAESHGIGAGWREDQSGSPEYLMAVNNAGTGQLWRSVGGTTAFNLVESTGPGGLTLEFCHFVQVIQNSGAGRMFFSADAPQGGGGVGTRLLNSAAASTQVDVTAKPPIVSHQSRMVCCNSNRTGIRFTAPGATTLTGTITPDPGGDAPYIVGMAAFSPSDLLVVYASGTSVMIQGDLSDPTVRVLGRGPVNGFANNVFIERLTDGTLVMPVLDRGAYQFTGEAWVPLSAQLDAGVYLDDSTSTGITWAGRNDGRVMPHYRRFGNLLFTPLGFIYDEETRSWFRCTALSRAWVYTTTQVGILGLDADNARQGYSIQPDTWTADGDWPAAGAFSGRRATSYTWKSVPLRHPEGQLSSVREVEVSIQNRSRVSCFESGVQALAPGFAVVNTVTVTVNGVVRSAVTSTTKEYDILRFQFPRDVPEYSQVTVTVTTTDNAGTTGAGPSNNYTSAPPIETIRFGWSPGKQVV